MNPFYPLESGIYPPSSTKLTKFSELPEAQRYVFSHAESPMRKLKHLGSCQELAFDGVPTILSWVEEEAGLEASGLRSLALMVEEDLVVVQALPGEQDRVVFAHLTSPLGWSAEGVIGQSFDQIHSNVLTPSGKPLLKDGLNLVHKIIQLKEPVQRIGALSFSSHSTIYQPTPLPCSWTWDENQEVFLRFERQVIVPFPSISSFLFTIRPYYIDITVEPYLSTCLESLRNMPKNPYHNEWFDKHLVDLIYYLENLID